MLLENKLVSHWKSFIKVHIIMVSYGYTFQTINTWLEQITMVHSLFIFIIINIMNTHNVSYEYYNMTVRSP